MCKNSETSPCRMSGQSQLTHLVKTMVFKVVTGLKHFKLKKGDLVSVVVIGDVSTIHPLC